MKQIKVILLLLLITVTGASAQSVAQFTLSDYSVCAGDTITGINTSVLAVADSNTEYLWVFTGAFTNVAVTADSVFSAIALGPDSGTITLYITDSLGAWISTYDTTVYIHPLPVITNVTPLNAMITCTSSSVPIVIYADTLSTISWYVNGINTGTTGLAFAALMSDTGHFHLVATSIFGCVATNAYEYTISDGTESPTLDISVCGQASMDTLINCFATDICGNVNDPFPPTQYAWSNGATTATLPVVNSGLYTVMVTNANGCTASDTAMVYIGLPAPTFTSLDTLCTGETISLSAPSGYSYLWTNGQTSQSIVVAVPGNYAVEISNGICSSTSNTAVIDFHGLPETNLVVQPCSIGLASFEAGATFQWYDQMSNPITGAIGPSYSVDSSGYFFVQVTSAYGCMSTSQVMPVQCTIISSVGDLLHIQSEKPYTMSIIDMMGKIVKSGRYDGDATMSMQELISGIYIVRIVYDDGKVSVQKIQKF